MKRIALIGAPGAGKSDVARALDERWETGPNMIIDGYADRLSKSTDIALGHFAGYIANLQVAFERLRQEQAGANPNGAIIDNIPTPPEHQITCGTLIETTLYVALHTRVLFNQPDIAERQMETMRADGVARILGQLVWDTWRYDHVFVLPYYSAVEGEWNTVLNDNLERGLGTYFIEYTTVPSDLSVDEKADFIYQEINDKAATTEADKSAIQSSGEASDEQRNSS